MKKYLYLICLIIVLLLINIIPVSAKDIKMCTRSETNLHVRDSLIKNNNLSNIMSTPCVDESIKVYDFADLLSDSEEDMLYSDIQNYIEKTKYDLAVVTITDNNKFNARDYADDFYDYNDFGFNKTRDGLLILLDINSRDISISTTGYAAKMYDDSRGDDVYEYGHLSATNGEYYKSFSMMIEKLTDYYDSGFPKSNINLVFDENGVPHYIKYINYPFVIFISAIITLVSSIIFYNTSRLKIKVGSTISYLKNKNIKIKNDTLVNSIVTHHPRSTDSSSGSSGGGTSFHTSSSGSFHGGSGGKF